MKRFWLFGIFCALFSCSGEKLRPLGEKPALDADYAAKVVKLSLECVDQEEPHYDEGQGKATHAEKLRHPVFYGCYDWHSAVHGHWAMLRVAGAFPELSETGEIKKTLARHLSAENLKAELAFLQKQPSFEEPYGWGWYLRLVQELHDSQLPGSPDWGMAAVPLEHKIVKLFEAYLKKTKLANRVGLHDNTAYAMVHAWDYAIALNDDKFLKALSKKAKSYYFSDRECLFANEPGPYDFISPCFVEADLMRRVLTPEEFVPWFNRFLPNLTEAQLKPVMPKDLKDYRQVHLVGLMYQRASAMHGVASHLPENDPRRALLFRASEEHARTAWKVMFDSGYGGTHWLASFAIYYYSGVGL